MHFLCTLDFQWFFKLFLQNQYIYRYSCDLVLACTFLVHLKYSIYLVGGRVWFWIMPILYGYVCLTNFLTKWHIFVKLCMDIKPPQATHPHSFYFKLSIIPPLQWTPNFLNSASILFSILGHVPSVVKAGKVNIFKRRHNKDKMTEVKHRWHRINKCSCYFIKCSSSFYNCKNYIINI